MPTTLDHARDCQALAHYHHRAAATVTLAVIILTCFYISTGKRTAVWAYAHIKHGPPRQELLVLFRLGQQVARAKELLRHPSLLRGFGLSRCRLQGRDPPRSLRISRFSRFSGELHPLALVLCACARSAGAWHAPVAERNKARAQLSRATDNI